MVMVTLLVAGLALLVIGAELLVRGAATIATTAGVRPLVVGLTVVAFGTSSPELAASLDAATSGLPDLALGNVVGSNIFNVLLILGVSAAITPLAVSRQLMRLDLPVMIGTSLAVWALGADGHISRAEGAVLVAAVIIYTVLLIRLGRRLPEVIGDGAGTSSRAAGRHSRRGWLGSSLRVLAGLGMLGLGSHWMVDGAVAVARLLQVSELVIGLTLVAAGTSLPEVATSVVAAYRSQRDIAVGNIIGSNVFNLTAVLGSTAIVAPRGVAVARQALGFDVPVMIAVSVVCWPLFFTGRVVSRREGWLLLGLYVVYLGWLLARPA